MSTNINIVLVKTSHPGNIGSTARAMKTMGLKKLTLVSPKNERAIKYNDPKLKIKWPVKKPNISFKDENANSLNHYIDDLLG